MRGIQNSQGLCRIVSSNDRLLNDATNEIERISTELVHQCGMPLPPKTITAEVTEDFIDPHMQHEKR
eukprot:CAMPEP_0202467780 /NCGR_PEP_ID=MMETSP1360-20130828/73324_1 /ASSEMBLY_ACC=CAM_ASM_000848 /TAXON_ID=515479 /ORGANISM="Licmophora paradoxa, Strain CCMP2313" /LENGTH=66 /DNA_ID=CAMNT_0049092463 /DNA_START=249 /DNA_END=445 /DNA_ORIENTATION=-